MGDVPDDGDRPMLGSMGPIGIDCRTPNEHIIRDSVIERALLLALVIDKTASEGNGGGGKRSDAATGGGSRASEV